MKIALQLAVPAVEGTRDAELIKMWLDICYRNIAMVKAEGTEVEAHIPRRGLRGLEGFYYSYLHHLNDNETLFGVIEAEKRGFDAVVLWCFYDPVLKDARQAVNIPVVGPAEASMLLATTMGSKFGVVTISPEAVFDMEENIVRCGLKERAVPIRPIEATATQQWDIDTMKYSKHEIGAFKKVARELIADGAETLIPGCLFMAPVIRLAPGAEEEYPNGLTDVDGVPVIDVVAASIKMAETLVSLKQASSTWISRKSFYAKASPAALDGAKQILEYTGPGFWTY